MSHSHEAAGWISSEWRESKELPGAAYRIARISLARRIEIAKQIRMLAGELEFADAGTSPDDQLRALILRCSIERVYIERGLLELKGVVIDGAPATPQSLIEWGPESLCREIATAVREQCSLSEDERKN